MQKRILSLLLAVVLVFGMLPVGVMASQTTAQTIYAVQAASLALDNKLTEAEWTATAAVTAEAGSGSISAVWDNVNLYLGITTDATSVTVALGEKSVEAVPVNGVAEFAASWSVLGVTLTDLYQTISGLQITFTFPDGSILCDANVVLTSMTANDINYSAMTANGNTGDMTVTSDSITWNVSGTGVSQRYISNVPLIDHSKDILLTQTLKIDSMPVGTGYTINESNESDDCYYFWISDVAAVEGSAIRCTVYCADEEGNLYIRIHKDRAADANDNAGVSLGKKLGDTFQLATLWRKDGGVEVYVDGKLILELDNGTTILSRFLGNKTYRFAYKNGAGNTAQLTVSDAVLTVSGTTTVWDNISAATVLSAMDLDNVTEDLDLPETYTVDIIGDVPLTWESSDPAVLSNTGIVTRQNKDTTVTLSLSCGEKDLGSVEVTVLGVEPIYQLQAVNGTPVDDDQLTDLLWTATAAVTENVPGNISAAWDKDNLYLGISTNAAKVTVTLNEKTAEAMPVDGAAEIVIPWSEAQVKLQDYYQVVSGLLITLTDENAETSLKAEVVLTSMTANDIDYSKMTPNGNTGDMTVTSDSITWDVSATGVSQRYIANVPLIDHSKDILLTQTVKIDSMPVSDGYITGENAAGNNVYYFWIVDYCDNVATDGDAVNANGSAVWCTVYRANEAGDLYLRLHKDGKYNGDDREGVSLGKSLGDTFQLSLLWCKDGSAAVYVDGKQIIEETDATIIKTRWLGSKCYRFAYLNGAGNTAQLTVSDAVLTVSGAETVMDAITPEAVLGNTDLTKITQDMDLPTAFASDVVGNIPLTWKSSDPAVLTDDGKITRGMKDQTVQLSLYVGEKLLWTVDVTVAGSTVRLEIVGTEELKLDNVMDELCWTDVHSMTGSAEGAPQGSVSFVYNRDGLYLGLSYLNANKLTAELNGKTMEITLSGEGVEEILLPWSDFGVILDDYGQVIDGLRLTLSGEGGTAVLSERACEIMLTSKRVTIVPMTAFGKTGNTADVTATASTATFKTNSIDQTRLYISNLSAVDHTKDVLMSQDLLFKTMPVSQGYFQQYGKANDSYYFWMSYGTATSTGPNIQVSVYRADEEGNLWLRACDGDHDNSNDVTVSLGKKLGEKFRLSVLWKAGTAAENYLDGGAEYYVDGKLVLSIADATFSGAGMGIQAIHMAYNNYTAAAATEFTVSNLNLIAGTVTSVLDEITTGAMIYGVDLTAVQGDMTLAETFESPYMGSVPVTWSSSNESVITTEGKVTNPEDDTQIPVTLTATARGKELFQVEVTVVAKPKDANTPVKPSPSTVTTGFSAETIRVDGRISEEGWALTTRVLNSENYIVGKFGAQWNADTLYLAFKADSAKKLRLELNGKELEIELDSLETSGDFEPVAIAKAGAYLELAISFAQLGLDIQDYNVLVPVTVEMDGSTFTGELKLISADWFIADNETRPLPATVRGSAALGNDAPVSGFQGVNQVAGGWRLYDLYNPAGDNPARVRTYAIYGNDAVYAPMAHRSQTIYTEFDFQADALPVYEVADAVGWAFAYNQMASYGMAWWLADDADSGSMSNSISLGIFNTSNGLMLAALPSDGATKTILLNKQVGELFRVGTAWKTNGDVAVYIDGEELITLEGVEGRRKWFGDTTLAFNLIRSTTPAAGEEDNMDVTITNLVSGHSYDDSLMDSLSWTSICGENSTPESVTSDLNLPNTLFNAQLTTPKAITWTSSEPDFISAEGKVTRPANGAVEVTLTATLADGSEKKFNLRVMGLQNDSGNVLVASRDYDPAKGAGSVVAEYEITLDSNNTSVIIDLQDKQAVNVVKLTDGDTAARLNEEVLTLWISDDNVTYTQIEDFKLLHQGENWYLYDFEAEARYVKVHCTHFDPKEADFVAPAANIITAYQDASLTAENTKTISVPATTLRDQAVEIQLPEGIVQANLRISLDEKLLYHYVENDKVYVRIPDPTTGELTLWNGGEGSLELSNKEYVYEITYGTRETRIISGEAHWLFTLPDGSMLTIRENGNTLWRAFSTDGGRTWSTNEQIACSKDYISEGGGFIYDSVTGRLMFQGHLVKNNNTANPDTMDSKTNIIYSDDFGKTWYQLATVQTDSNYTLSYTDGIQLNCYDGEGPNVDFVFPLGCYLSNEVGFCARVAYTTDGGKNWQTGEDKIIYDGGYGNEGGVSECTIQERDDGTLVLMGRNQLLDSVHFAQSYSYDHGITWTNPAKLSDNYTGNTQPIMYRYDESMILTWGGNHMMGGASYLRMPYNVAVSYDGMETWKNIQDLYVKYSLQGLTAGTQNRITNQSVQKVGEDEFVSSWWNHTDNMSNANTLMMRVSNFTDYLYRTKGAYDSFEHGTVKYEGWEATGGDVLLSNEQKSGDNGSYSMKLVSATVARSVPYVQNGTVSMDIWVDGTSSFSVELQSAYTNVSGKGAPVGFKVDGYAVTFLDTEEASSLTLQEGWNTVVFELLLDAETPSATLSVNDSTAKTMPVNQQIGDYVSFVTIMNSGTVYVDNFLLVDAQDAEIYEQSAEGKVMQLIAAIGTVTLDSEERIATARAAYNALTDEQKKNVTNLIVLTVAETELASLKELSIYSLEASVSLNDEVCYNFYFKLAEELTGTDVADMGLLVWESEPADPTCGNNAKAYPGAVACTGDDAGKYKVSTDGVAAKNMGDAWYFRIYAKKSDGTYAYSKLFQYSAKTYAMNKIKENEDADLTKLCIALLNYGAEAQKYFKSEGTYDYTELMNAELTEEQKQIGYKDGMVAGLIQADESKIGVFKATEGGFEKKEASVSLGGALSINYYLTATNAATDMKLYVWNSETYGNAETLTAENATVIHMSNVSGNEFKGTVTGIVARQFDKTVYVCGEYEANGTVYRTGVIAYSFGKYCVNKAGQEVAERDVAMAAAVYGCYASQYLN